jgi:signal transduction histidine kinase/CheY-like chemotaxis protein
VPPTKSKSLASLYWSLVVTTTLAAALVASTFWLATRMHTENEWVRHTLAVRNQIAQLLILVQRAESSQRGYLLTGRDVYLQPYEGATSALPPALDEAAKLVADNPPQVQALERLRSLATDKLSELRTTIEDRKAGKTDQALAIVNSDEGRRLMDDIRRVAASMEAEENRLLAERQSAALESGVLLRTGAAIALFMICLVGALVGYFTRRSFTELATAHEMLVVKNRALVNEAQRREQIEGQLRQSQKMEAIGQLTGGIAHDFNNMLGVITGSLELMQRRIKKGDFGIERFMEAAVKATERAATLTHRLLAFARQQPLAPEPVDANKMIASMSDLLRSTLGEHIRIETVAAAGLWSTNADAHQLESAVLNIAINARDAMPDGGRLTIETANAYLDDAYCRANAEVEPGQFVLIAVSDTGCGMKPDVAARAFDPFFTTKPTGKGTGLGLSQVHGFVKQSRGHIKIYSEIGAGTTVKLYLPLLIDGTTEVKRTVPRPAKPGAANEVILVVEDDPLMRRLAADALRELGYTVLHTETAAAALDVLDKTPAIKLLFTDVVMPEVNGKKLADEALRRRPDLKVLFTTGYTPNAVVHGGVLDAGVHLLTKPFTIEQLATKVRAVLDA